MTEIHNCDKTGSTKIRNQRSLSDNLPELPLCTENSTTKQVYNSLNNNNNNGNSNNSNHSYSVKNNANAQLAAPSAAQLMLLQQQIIKQQNQLNQLSQLNQLNQLNQINQMHQRNGVNTLPINTNMNNLNNAQFTAMPQMGMVTNYNFNNSMFAGNNYTQQQGIQNPSFINTQQIAIATAIARSQTQQKENVNHQNTNNGDHDDVKDQKEGA